MKRSLVLASLLLTAACTTTQAPPPATVAAAPAPKPFPSTYKAYPGVPTVIRGATIYDGAGKRIDNGQIRIENGKVAEIGTTVSVPANATVIEANGRYVTPGIIDIHSHLGVYPSPGVDANSDGNEATSPARPEVWAEHSVWPQDPGFSRAMASGMVAHWSTWTR